MNPSTPEAGRRGEELLRVENLAVHFPIMRGVLFQSKVGFIHSVDGVSFTLRRGETLGLVGECGGGKPWPLAHPARSCPQADVCHRPCAGRTAARS